MKEFERSAGTHSDTAKTNSANTIDSTRIRVSRDFQLWTCRKSRFEHSEKLKRVEKEKELWVENAVVLISLGKNCVKLEMII
jgi:hypothetical protein